jgi:hypothetical protein
VPLRPRPDDDGPPPPAAAPAADGAGASASATGGLVADAEDPRAASAATLLALFLKAARAAQLYPRQSRIRREMQEAFAAALTEHLRAHGETVLEVGQLQILAFGQSVYEEPNRQRSLAFRLFVNGVRSVTFEPGLTPDEADGVVDVLTTAFRPDASAEDIQTSVWERCFVHVAFEVQEEAFGDKDAAEFAGFLEETETDPASAEAYRDAEEPLWEALEALPPSADDDAAPVVLTPQEQAHLAELRTLEESRDLFSEVADFLLDALQGGEAESVRGCLEQFFEHLLAAGDVLRAARTLATLRRVSASAARTGAGDILADVVERIGRVKIVPTGAGDILADVVERIGRVKIVPALAPLAGSLTPADRDGFTMLLTAIGEPAIGPVCEMLGTDAHELALHALASLAPRHPAALPPLLEDARPQVVRAIVPLVAAHGGSSVPALLRPALRHADPAVRRDALRAIATAGGAGVTDLLLTFLDDPLYELRATALDALGGTRDPRAVPPLLSRVRSGKASPYELRELYRALGRIGSSAATAALAQTLSTTGLLQRADHDEQRALAASALALAGNAGARAALRRHEKDRSPAVRYAVKRALAEVDSRSVAVRPTSRLATPSPRPDRT